MIFKGYNSLVQIVALRYPGVPLPHHPGVDRLVITVAVQLREDLAKLIGFNDSHAKPVFVKQPPQGLARLVTVGLPAFRRIDAKQAHLGFPASAIPDYEAVAFENPDGCQRRRKPVRLIAAWLATGGHCTQKK